MKRIKCWVWKMEVYEYFKTAAAIKKLKSQEVKGHRKKVAAGSEWTL